MSIADSHSYQNIMSSSANIINRRNPKPRSAKLCTRCSKLDLSSIFASRPLTARGHDERKLPSTPKWSIGICSVCTILAAAFPLRGGRYEKEKIYLRSFSSKKVHKIGWDIFDTAMIGINQSGSAIMNGFTGFGLLVPQNIGAESVRVVEKDTIGFRVPQSWLQFCETNHTKRCHLETQPDVPNLRLFNAALVLLLKHKVNLM